MELVIARARALESNGTTAQGHRARSASMAGSKATYRGDLLKTIQELAGHKTIQMTARYSHLSPGHLHNAVELIAATKQPPAKHGLTNSHQNRHPH